MYEEKVMNNDYNFFFLITFPFVFTLIIRGLINTFFSSNFQNFHCTRNKHRNQTKNIGKELFAKLPKSTYILDFNVGH